MAAADDSTADPTAITRRDALVRGGTAAGTVGLMAAGGERVHPKLSPVGRAEAVAPLIGAGLIIGGAIAGGSATLIAQDLLGGSDGTDKMLEAAAEERHQSMFTNAVETELSTAYTLDSASNSAMMLRAYVRTNASFDIVNEIHGREDDDEQTVKDDALSVWESTVAESVSTLERNHYRMWRLTWLQAMRMGATVEATSELSGSDVFRTWNPDDDWSTTQLDTSFSPVALEGYSLDVEDPKEQLESENEDITSINWGEQGFETPDIPLVDGTTMPQIPAGLGGLDQNQAVLVPWAEWQGNGEPDMSNGSASGHHLNPWSDGFDGGDSESMSYSGEPALTKWGVVSPETGEVAEVLDTFDWAEAHQEILNVYDDEIAYGSQVIDRLYQPILNGEVTPGDIMSAEALINNSINEDSGFDNWNRAAGIFRGLFMHESDQVVHVALDSGLTLEGKLFMTSDSAAESGLEVGTSINPENVDGSINVSGEVVDWTEDVVEDDAEEDPEGQVIVGEIAESFEIEETVDGSGSVSFEVNEIKDAGEETEDELLQRLLDAYDSEQESQKTTETVIVNEGGGDGSQTLMDWLTDSTLGIPHWIPVAGGAGLIGYNQLSGE